MMSAHIENERLSGQEPALDILILLHDVDNFIERLQGLYSPGIGNVVGLPVVHRDNRYLACLL